MSLQNCYISCACNHTPSIAHWGKNNLICYGSCNAVLIYDPHIGGGKVPKSLCKHTKRVCSVKWISGKDHETELVSGSADGTAVVWSLQSGEYIPYVLQGHEGNVNVVDGLYKDVREEYIVVVTASIDSTVKVWTRLTKTAQFTQTQSIDFGYNLCLYLKVTFLTCDTLLLACTTDRSQIELFVDGNKNEINFIKSETLKGHEDWVRGVDFIRDVNGDVLLATSGQDHVICLFRISQAQKVDSEKYSLKTSCCNYKIIVESILTGHEGWIYSVNWSPTGLRLLSASIDKTVLIWEYDESVNLWLETTRLGEVGGNTLGFYGAVFGPDGKSIMAHSYHGAFHMWNFCETSNSWEPVVTVGGHFNEVTDLSWEPKGEFLISVSSDQTTRIHAPWKTNKDKKAITWHEIARPQVHGYDINCLAVLSRYKFATGAEEKVIRAFHAPENFVQNFRRICQVDEENINGLEVIPRGAAVPSLGLSNKAVYENNNDEEAKPKSNKDPYPEESHFTAIDLESPPTEETLIQNTLWPEIQKLYGHGYEVYSLAATSDGKILASACKATTVEHAAIILWDTSNWNQVQKLTSHTLTVSQMAFSPDTNHLLSVSRDRRWSLFSKSPESNKYELVATTDKKTGIHTRIIWCCAWSHDSKYFGTGSRDGKVVVWCKNPDKTISSPIGLYEAASDSLDLKGESITALAFAPDFVDTQYLIAVGLESGHIHLYKWDRKWTNVLTMDIQLAHHLCVKRLAFRPRFGRAGSADDDDKSMLQLASCGADYSVKITNLEARKL